MADLGYSGGKRKRQAAYGRTQREVVDRLNELLRDHQRGVLPTSGRTTVEQWLTTWLGAVESTVWTIGSISGSESGRMVGWLAASW